MDVVDAGKKVVEEILDQFGDTPIKAIPAETVSRGKEALESVLEEFCIFFRLIKHISLRVATINIFTILKKQ